MKLGFHLGRKGLGELIISFQSVLYFKIPQHTGGEGKGLRAQGTFMNQETKSVIISGFFFRFSFILYFLIPPAAALNFGEESIKKKFTVLPPCFKTKGVLLLEILHV